MNASAQLYHHHHMSLVLQAPAKLCSDSSQHALLALRRVCGGAQLYLWEYSRFGSSPAPETCLKTRRSLRAVHFHPHAVPLILTAEVRIQLLQQALEDYEYPQRCFGGCGVLRAKTCTS